MDKAKLITELATSKASTLTILNRGYLKQVAIDAEVYAALVSKLSQEAQSLQQRLEMLIQGGHDPSLTQALQDLEKVVHNTVLSRLQQEPSVQQWTRQIQQRVHGWLPKLEEYQSQGFEFVQDSNSGAFKIVNSYGAKVYESPFVSLKTILQEWGLDTSDPKFDLFFFTLVPAEDVRHYRAVYAFAQFFHFT